jgi:hypothetical protein
MSIQAADLRKLVKIVRQYEVIYGGGISSGDAAVREECEDLVGLLESELGGKKAPSGRGARGAGSLPSLVEARRNPRGEASPKPSTARSSAIARLGRPQNVDSAAKGKTKAEAPKPAARKAEATKAAATAAKSSAQKAVGRPVAGKSAAGKTAAGKPATAAKAAASGKSVQKPDIKVAARQTGENRVKGASAVAIQKEDEVYQDVRSRHVPAARAALERADRIAGAAGSSGQVEGKHHFAALHLFDAFQQNRLPKYGGFIVCVRFSEKTGYAVIEIIGYGNMQDLYPDGDTLVFKSVGCKLFAIVEPPAYLLKSVEPVNRPSEQMIPYRFSELLKITTKRFQNIMVGRKPVFMPTSFSVFKPEGENLAVLFYDIADVYANIQDFLIMILRDRLGVPIPDSRKAAEIIARGIHEFRLWLDEA